MSKTIGEVVHAKRCECSVEQNSSLRDTLGYMRDRSLGAVAVMDGDRVVGVIAGRDIIRRVVLENVDMSETTARDIMTSPVFWISTDEHHEVAAAIMVDQDLRQLVVLDGNKEFWGFVTALELLQIDLVESRKLVGKLNDSYYAPKYHG